MATVNLLPNADISNNMSYSAGTDVYALLDDDHSGGIGSDSSYMYTTTSGKSAAVAFQDFGESASSIDGVQIVTRVANASRGATYTIEMTMEGSGGTFYSGESSGSLNASGVYRTVTFTNRTTSDGSSAWTESDVNDLRASVRVTALSGGTLQYTYCYAIITYTEAVTATDNSIFFGTNF